MPKTFGHNYNVYLNKISNVRAYVILRRVRETTVARKSNKSYIFHVSVALGIQHAMRMRRIILSSVACLALPYFFTLSHKRRDFWIKFAAHKMFTLIFSTTFSETFLILSRIEQDIIINIRGSSCKVLDVLVSF